MVTISAEITVEAPLDVVVDAIVSNMAANGIAVDRAVLRTTRRFPLTAAGPDPAHSDVNAMITIDDAGPGRYRIAVNGTVDFSFLANMPQSQAEAMVNFYLESSMNDIAEDIAAYQPPALAL